MLSDEDLNRYSRQVIIPNFDEEGQDKLLKTKCLIVGAGGLGDLIFNGLALYEPEMIIVGTILVTLLALIVDLILAQIEKWIIPKGLKISR